MPRVKSQKAKKDYPEQGIQKGDTYYKWSFRYGGTHKSKTYPRPSQLTQSKYSTVYAALESVQDMLSQDGMTIEDVVCAAGAAADEIREVASEYEEADEQMGGHQGANSERAQACEECADELESAVSEFDGIHIGPDDEYETMEDAMEACRDMVGSVELNEV